MRWIFLALLIALASTLQTTLAPRLEVGQVRADWLLPIVVFIALMARRIEVPWLAAAIGATADLLTVEPMGLFTLSYTLTSLLVLALREHVFRERWTTTTVLTAFCCILLQTGWSVYSNLRYDEPFSFETFRRILGAGIYSALWAPLIFAGLAGVSTILGFPRIQGWRRFGRRELARV